jgi:hypothetical protein
MNAANSPADNAISDPGILDDRTITAPPGSTRNSAHSVCWQNDDFRHCPSGILTSSMHGERVRRERPMDLEVTAPP